MCDEATVPSALMGVICWSAYSCRTMITALVAESATELSADRLSERSSWKTVSGIARRNSSDRTHLYTLPQCLSHVLVSSEIIVTCVSIFSPKLPATATAAGAYGAVCLSEASSPEESS
ncbi:hypothetical protein OGATHE_001310 [Ogataea polymorpha]|uniref:Uncharacterized protein n=1 Tax=Ogataea polymorpha TaxID=460523 RepID=A0A9P8TFL8_9ASCO|nr:hypothetical protein OGATHE_001310 [Ogataea polymorpha]